MLSAVLGWGLVGTAAVAGLAMWNRQVASAKALQNRDPSAGFEGLVVKGYLIGRRLHEGRHGPLHEATRNDSHVAMKLVERHTINPRVYQRERKALKARTQWSHPNLVRLYGEGETTDFFYVLMELMEAGSLETRLTDVGLPLTDALQVVRPLADGLMYLHQRGLVHAEVRPDNVLFSHGGEVKLASYGMPHSQVHHRVWETKMSGAARLVERHVARYMAPEQLRNDAPSVTADQWALGIILYRLLSGRLPFDSPSPVEIILKASKEEPPPLSSLRPDLPAALDTVVRKMLGKTPNDRYPDLATAMQALELAAH